MSKKPLAAFIALCVVICAVISVGTLFHPTTEPIGNEPRVSFPRAIQEDGSLNIDFFSELGEWFEKSFAFRPEIITADSFIKANVFGVSNIDSVIVGTDGWLYYSSTLDNYLGRDPLSSYQIAGLVHNLEMIQRRVESTGADFLFTIAPNKNTLYPDNMPYQYSIKANEGFDRDALNIALAHSSVDYCDLFEVFDGRDEVLYFMRDSHWNNKGALLAYDEILDHLEKAHDDFHTIVPERRKDFIGDLDKMISPASPQTEYNYYYGAEDRYEYVTKTTSVEDPLIRTKNPDASGSLFMYRDSFGNLLVPFFASAYGTATFTKSFPMMLDYELNTNHPDTVILEIAERNASWFLSKPPLIEAPMIDASSIVISNETQDDAAYEITAKPCEYSPLYLTVSGKVDSSKLADTDVIYLLITDQNGEREFYECYNYLAPDGTDGFLAYLDANRYLDQTQLEIIVVAHGNTGYETLGTITSTIEASYEN